MGADPQLARVPSSVIIGSEAGGGRVLSGIVIFYFKATCSDVLYGKQTKTCASAVGKKLRRKTDPELTSRI